MHLEVKVESKERREENVRNEDAEEDRLQHCIYGGAWSTKARPSPTQKSFDSGPAKRVHETKIEAPSRLGGERVDRLPVAVRCSAQTSPAARNG